MGGHAKRAIFTLVQKTVLNKILNYIAEFGTKSFLQIRRVVENMDIV